MGKVYKIAVITVSSSSFIFIFTQDVWLRVGGAKIRLLRLFSALFCGMEDLIAGLKMFKCINLVGFLS